MKVWIYVEGESDRLALQALWMNWCQKLRKAGHGINIIPLDNKAKYFRKIGRHAAEKLCANDEDIVVGLPDLYPNHEYAGGKYEHKDLSQLKFVQKNEVNIALQKVFGLNQQRAEQLIERFKPTALKHDLEMLLLAAHKELRDHLGTPDRLGKWCNPVEDQDQDQPPKRIVEELFRTKSKTRYAYRDTKDATAVLRKVTDIKTIIYHANGQINCPVFKELLDWIGGKTAIPAYS